jgi:alkanesulfonate monooxygenase SsuD/methylene tetrahydromethanopterin reductase-like flavin-dependent oxidoreductase (luciferase family)/putative sterol carrier protein
MRFGIFYEHQLPRPWDGGAEEKLLHDALDQVELADRLGFHAVWEVEHHFLEEYSHSSASEVFLAAASQRTKNIRLGYGIVAMPPGYQHPARVAAKVSTLDLVSGGRVELGTGETSSGAELGGFRVDRETKREQWDEAVDVATRMMVEEPFAGYDGRFLQMPIRNVVPKPSQKPHPPLWVACSRRETIRLAAEKGMGVLSFSFIEPEEAKQWVDEYHEIIASDRCVPAGFAVNPRFAVVLPMMCHEDEATAIERGIDGAHFFGYSLAHYYVFGEHHPGRTNIYEEFLERRDEVGFARDVINPDDAPLGIKILQEGMGSLRGAIGTPDQIRDLCRRYEQAGVDQVIFVSQAGRNRHEHICESLELLGRDVLPEFAARADEADAGRAVRFAAATEAALARREGPRTADPDYTIAPLDSGPPAGSVNGSGPFRAARGPAAGNGGGAGGGSRAAGQRQALTGRLQKRGEEAFSAFVRRSDDRRLERTLGSEPGLRVLFTGMAKRFRPDKAEGFEGEIQYRLQSDGTQRPWVLDIRGGRAQARPGVAGDAKLTLSMSTADFLRVAAHDLDPGKALMTGRLHLEGDFGVATKLGVMFGEPSPY